MAVDLGHDRTLRVRAARLFDCRPGRHGGGDEHHVPGPSRARADRAVAGSAARRCVVARDERSNAAISAHLRLYANLGAAIADHGALLYRGDNRLGGTVLAGSRRPLEGPVPGRPDQLTISASAAATRQWRH